VQICPRQHQLEVRLRRIVQNLGKALHCEFVLADRLQKQLTFGLDGRYEVSADLFMSKSSAARLTLPYEATWRKRTFSRSIVHALKRIDER